MADTIKTTILSGIQQSTFASYLDARNAGVKGKLLLARVTGGTWGADDDGKLVSGNAQVQSGTTYLFMGKKCYGSFPQLPVELLGALGLSSEEANEGVVTSLTDYYTSSSITEILKEIKNGNSAVSPSNTVIIGTSKDGEKSATTFDVNIDNKTIVSASTGELSVASSAISAVTKIELNNPSSAVMQATSAKTNGENIVYTLGLSGGATNQIIKKTSAGTYEWAYETSTEIATGNHSGVTVSFSSDPTTQAKTYTVAGNYTISSITNGQEGSGLVTTYKLVDADGNQFGSEIKTINDVFLKEAKLSAQTEEGVEVSGIAFVWYVRSPENPSGTATASTFVPLSDLDTYNAGSGITIEDKTNTIIAHISTDNGNLLKYGSDSGLTISAVSSITVNGTEYTVENPDLGALVSSVTPTVNGKTSDAFSGEVTASGDLKLNIALSADQVSFSPSATTGMNSGFTGTNVQTIVEEIASALTDSTDGVLTITTNGKSGEVITAGTYNPSADTTINIPQLSALTIGDEAFEFNESATSAHIATVSASAITFTYTGSGNTTWSHSASTADETINEIIDKLDNANVSGLSAISASQSESGTLVSLTLNKSNTTPNDPTLSIVSSESGATAVGAITAKTSTNAVKMSQDSANGLFVYIEIDGDDIDD